MSETLFVSFTHITCCHEKCGITFGVTDSRYRNLSKSHSTFYCPNGHEQHFPGESDEEKAKRFEKKFHDEQERTRLARVDAIYERTKKERAQRRLSRIRRGVCTHCNRSFENVRRHMASKHGKKKGKR